MDLDESPRGWTAPPDTVRGWLRAARANAAQLRASGVPWLVALDLEPGPVTPMPAAIADAVEAVLLAVRASALRSAATPPMGRWQRAQSLTGGLLSSAPLPP